MNEQFKNKVLTFRLNAISIAEEAKKVITDFLKKHNNRYEFTEDDCCLINGSLIKALYIDETENDVKVESENCEVISLYYADVFNIINIAEYINVVN